MSGAKPVDLAAARETAKRLRARDMPGAADDYDAMADEIERLRDALRDMLETYGDDEPNRAAVVYAREVLPPT